MQKIADYYRDGRPDPDAPVNPAKIDRQLTFDRLTNVHYSGTRHAEDQPSHLIVHDADICRTRCREEYGNPCTRFCPGQRLRDGRRRRRHEDACRSTRRTASTARRATSWTRTRSSTGCRRKAAAARSTRACERPRASDAALGCEDSVSRPANAARRTLHCRSRWPLVAALGRTLTVARRGRRRTWTTIAAVGPAADLSSFWHGRIFAGTVLLPRSRHRRHHQPELRRRVDRAHHRAVRLRHGARIDVTRRGARAGAVATRSRQPAVRPASRSTARAGPRGWRSRGRLAGRRYRAPDRCRFTSEAARFWEASSWDRTQIPKPFSHGGARHR